MTEADVPENAVLSNRDKKQHSEERALDSKHVQTERATTTPRTGGTSRNVGMKIRLLLRRWARASRRAIHRPAGG